MDHDRTAAHADQLGAGSAQCQRCSRHDGLPCAYIDGQDRSCGTDWCPDHRLTIQDQCYCRRHAGIVAALGAFGPTVHLPDVDNRAHSLANWVGNDLDEGIREIFEKAKKPDGLEAVLSEPIAYVYTPYRTHLWERAWKLVTPTGTTRKVSIDVDEDNDTEVRLRIDRKTVMSMVPPWIDRRFAGPKFASDEQARREYYSVFLAAIRDGLAKDARL